MDERVPQYRVEHRSGDGPARALLVSTSRVAAESGAAEWVRRLGRAGAAGSVAIVDAATGVALRELPLAAPAPPPSPWPALVARWPDLRFLTRRQREVVRLAAVGLPPAAIAAELGLSTVTVLAHLRAARRRVPPGEP